MGIFDGCVLLSDVDGTLLQSGHPIPPRNLQAIQRFIANGGKFAISTGRSVRAAEAVYRASGSNTALVCSNGAALYDFENEHYLYCMHLADSVKETVLPLIKQYGCGAIVDCEWGSYILHANAQTAEHMQRVGLHYPCASFGDLREKPWIKALLMADDEATADAMYAQAEKLPLAGAYFLRTQSTYIELTCAAADKAVGAAELKKVLGARQLFAIGDYDNDLHMLQAADVSATVCNAPDYIKNTVDHICGDPAAGAVADFIAILERMKTMDANTTVNLQKTACNIRMGIIEGTHSAKSGHPGGSLSCADILAYLYFVHMHIDPKNPKDPARDRFVLSKGHAAPALYATLAERGYFDKEELKHLRHTGALLQGHPDLKKIPGVDMSSGSLGQGISAAVGMALSAKHYKDTYRVYTILGDGECEEGQVWEAAMFAANKGLDNLVAFIDVNNLQIDGTLEEVNSPLPLDKKFEAFGWHVLVIDGHDFSAIESALADAAAFKGAPTAIIANTIKGKGVSYMENQVSWHGAAPNDEKYEIAMQELKAQLAAL